MPRVRKGPNGPKGSGQGQPKAKGSGSKGGTMSGRLNSNRIRGQQGGGKGTYGGGGY